MLYLPKRAWNVAKRRLGLDEARPECERVVLSKALLVILPSFARDATMQYRNLGRLSSRGKKSMRIESKNGSERCVLVA